MQDVPLTVTHLFERAEQYFGHKGVTTATPAGGTRQLRGVGRRTRRLGGALDTLGISADGRVATFAWNTARHLELYFAAPCTGRVLHTLNIRLFPEQLTYIVNHADDEVIFVDRSLLACWPRCCRRSSGSATSSSWTTARARSPTTSPATSCSTTRSCSPPRHPSSSRRRRDRAASMCYTSGTTGNPKGVVYSHRSTFLHTMGVMTADSLGARESDRILPVSDVPRQRVGPGPRRRRRGRRPVMPGRTCRARRSPTSSWRNGSPSPPASDDLDAGAARAEGPRHVEPAGDPVRRLGGAEGAVGGLPRAARPADPAGVGDDRDEPGRVGVPPRRRRGVAVGRRAGHLRTGVGRDVRRRVPGRRPDTLRAGAPDGESSGELQCRGHWIAATYYNDARAGESFTADGWLRTGDVATMDARAGSASSIARRT